MAPRTPLIYPASYFEDRSRIVLPGSCAFVAYLVGTVVTTVLELRVLLSRVYNPPEMLEQRMFDVLVKHVLPTLLVGEVVILGIAVLAAYFETHHRQGHSISSVIGAWKQGDTRGSPRGALGVVGWAYVPQLLVLPYEYARTRANLQEIALNGARPEPWTDTIEGAVTYGPEYWAIQIGALAWGVYIVWHGLVVTQDADRREVLLPALLVGGLWFSVLLRGHT